MENSTGFMALLPAKPVPIPILGLPQELWDRIGDFLTGKEMTNFLVASRLCRWLLYTKAFNYVTIKGEADIVSIALEKLVSPFETETTLPIIGQAIQ